MRKIFRSALVIFVFAGLSVSVTVVPGNINKVQAAPVPHDVTLTTTVLEYLTFDITAGDTVAFGNLTPGTPICYATTTVASVTTNAANGYTLGLHDDHAASSSMVNTDTTTHIPKMTNGTIGTPVEWGSNYGVGTSMWAATTNKEAKWGDGDAVCVPTGVLVNKYAAIPETDATAHTVTGVVAGADTSSWSFKIDVQNTQKTGAYSGTITYTATAVLS